MPGEITTYRVRLYRGSHVIKDLGRCRANRPDQAFCMPANEYVAKGWRYEEQASGSGHLVNPRDPNDRLVAEREKE